MNECYYLFLSTKYIFTVLSCDDKYFPQTIVGGECCKWNWPNVLWTFFYISCNILTGFILAYYLQYTVLHHVWHHWFEHTRPLSVVSEVSETVCPILPLLPQQCRHGGQESLHVTAHTLRVTASTQHSSWQMTTSKRKTEEISTSQHQ